MDRRADPAPGVDDARSGVDDPSDAAPDDPKESKKESKAWAAVRRALGRVLGRAGVRSLSDAERTIAAPLREGALTFPPPAVSRGDAWKPSAATALAPVPSAGAGLRESDLLPRVTLAAGDYAVGSPPIAAMPGADTLKAALGEIPLLWPLTVIALPESFVRLPESPVKIGRAALPAEPKTTALGGWGLPVPAGAKLLRLPRFAEPRIKWGGDSVLRRMPVVRRSRPVAGGGQAERRRLAETVSLAPDEVTLLGVYPDVPILAVERIVVEDEGRRLKVWLKPEVLRGRSGAHRITLLVGRQAATGKMLQAAL